MSGTADSTRPGPLRFAVIAAGEGSRLRAEGVSSPKPLLEIGGVPLIERLVQIAERAGAAGVSLIVNEESPAVVDYLERRPWRVPHDLLVRSTPSSLHSLVAMAPTLRGGPFCLFTVDTVFREPELRSYLAHAAGRRNVLGTLAVTDFVHDEKPLCARLDGSGRILALEDVRGAAPWVTAGVYRFNPPAMDEIQAALDAGNVRLRNALRFLLARGHVLDSYRFSRVVDVDHVSDIALAEQLVEEERAALMQGEC